MMRPRKLKIAVALAKPLVDLANYLFDGNQNFFATWQGTSPVALKCRNDANDTYNKANDAYNALVPLAEQWHELGDTIGHPRNRHVTNRPVSKSLDAPALGFGERSQATGRPGPP